MTDSSCERAIGFGNGAWVSWNFLSCRVVMDVWALTGAIGRGSPEDCRHLEAELGLACYSAMSAESAALLNAGGLLRAVWVWQTFVRATLAIVG